MARVLTNGTRVGRYEVVDRLNHGAFAISYKAVDGATPVFLKQYKMPSITTPWYRAYVKHQQEIKRRVEDSRLKNYTYRFIDFFEETVGAPCYFQVFEFVEHGQDLRGILDRIRENPEGISWAQRMIFAKVMMAGIGALHEAKIVHTDLKPENIELFEAPYVAARYTLRIVDMDFSILADKRPPWHSDPDFGVVGTPGYLSPEHAQGIRPLPASDVFTCGLMLYELLADGHPYPADSPEEYTRQVLRYRAASPAVAGPVAPPADKAVIAETIHRCLDPDPRKRPTALDVNRALNGTASAPAPAPIAPPGPVPPRPKPVVLPSPARPDAARPAAPAPLPSPGPAAGRALVLVGPSGGRLEVRVRTALGRALVSVLTAEHQYWAADQCILSPSGGREWAVEANPSAPNETLVNGKVVSTRTSLRDGDVIAVGRAAKGVTKGPITVHLE